MNNKKYEYMKSLADTAESEIEFYGCETAELFSKEIKYSLQGVLEKSFVWNPDEPENINHRFVSTSVDGRVCSDHLWSRDAGVLLRELAEWGYLGHARYLTEILIDLADKNDEGYYSYPMWFYQGQKSSGSELDGTASIIIGMSLFFRRLSQDNPVYRKILDFLICESSPVKYLLKKLAESPLLVGTGEFGTGTKGDGEYCNVVQNNLVCLAIESVVSILGEQCELAAKTLRTNIAKYMIDGDGKWLWCVNRLNFKPDYDLLNDDYVVGFGGINGVMSMTADVWGFDSSAFDSRIFNASLKTFDALFNMPLRREQYEKYGMWPQWDRKLDGLLTSPSYGQGYALQTALLLDKTYISGRLIEYLAKATYSPPEPYKIDRDNPYQFYERMLSPDFDGLAEFDQGCGALNLVNVAEPLKIARIMAGIDNTGGNVRIIPGLPDGWTGYTARNWLIFTDNGLKKCDIVCEKTDGGYKYNLSKKD